MSQQFYQTYFTNSFIPTFNPTINSSRIDYPQTNSAKQADIKELQYEQIYLNPQTKKAIIIKPNQIANIITNQDEYQRKIIDLEQGHKNQLKELEVKMQQKIDLLLQKRQEYDQFKQLFDVQQQIAEIQSSLQGNNFSNPYFQQQQQKQQFYIQIGIERLEKQLKKKIKFLKSEIDSLTSELQNRSQKLTELEIKLYYSQNKPIIQQSSIPQIITVPQINPLTQTIIQESPELLDRIRSLEFGRDSLLKELRRSQ